MHGILPYPPLLRSRCLVYAAATNFRYTVSPSDTRTHNRICSVFHFGSDAVTSCVLCCTIWLLIDRIQEVFGIFPHSPLRNIIGFVHPVDNYANRFSDTKSKECVPIGRFGNFVSSNLFPLQQELVKHTHDATDKSNLRKALDAMKVYRFIIIIFLSSNMFAEPIKLWISKKLYMPPDFVVCRTWPSMSMKSSETMRHCEKSISIRNPLKTL